MPALPYLGRTAETEDWTQEQLRSWAICAYLVMTGLICTAVIAILNLLQFICEEKCNRCYQSMRHPLIVFYILTIATLIYDVLGIIWFLKIANNGNWLIFFTDMPPILKALVGVE